MSSDNVPSVCRRLQTPVFFTDGHLCAISTDVCVKDIRLQMSSDDSFWTVFFGESLGKDCLALFTSVIMHWSSVVSFPSCLSLALSNGWWSVEVSELHVSFGQSRADVEWEIGEIGPNMVTVEQDETGDEDR